MEENFTFIEAKFIKINPVTYFILIFIDAKHIVKTMGGGL